MRTLKIVVVSKCLPYLAGPAVFAFEEAKALAQMGHDVHFVTYKSYPHGTTIPDLDPAVLRNSGIMFHLVQEPISNKVIGSQIAIAMLSEVLNIAWSSSQKPDFLRAHYAMPHGLIAVTAGKLLGIPSVVSLQGSDVATLAKMDGFREASIAVFQHADLLTPVAQVLYEQVDELTQGRHSNMLVMPSPVDTERFHPEASLSIPNGVRIIYTGRLHDIKAIDVLICGFGIAQRRVNNLPMSLTVAGVGPELPNLKQLAKKLGLEGSIMFVEGIYAGLPELYRNHNVFATASQSTEEGMPFSVVEALASGLDRKSVV